MFRYSQVVHGTVVGILAIGIMFGFSAPVFAQGMSNTAQQPTPSAAITKLRAGLKDTAGKATISTTTDGLGLPGLIGRLIGMILSFLAVVFFCIILIASVGWMLSRENETLAKKSTSAVTAAISGLIVIAAAYAITNFVLDSIGVKKGSVPPSSPPQSAQTVPVGSACLSNADCVAGAECDSGTCQDICDGLFTGSYDCRPRSLCDRATIEEGVCSGGPSVACCREPGLPSPRVPNTRCVSRICQSSYTQAECSIASDCEITADGCVVRGEFPCNDFSDAECPSQPHCELR